MVFPSMLEETERIERYIKKNTARRSAPFTAVLWAVPSWSFWRRGEILIWTMESSDLDQAGTTAAKLKTALVMKMMYPLLQGGGFRSGFMRKIYDRQIAKMGSYGRKITRMLGIGAGGLPFVSKESVRNQFYSDLVTLLPDHIRAEGTEIHILYALKMGEKYRARYWQHFEFPILHELGLQHEELLACKTYETTKGDEK